MSEHTEEWRPVVGYEGYYEVSDQGRVRSLDRLEESGRGWLRSRRSRVLRHHLRAGYPAVTLTRDGVKVDASIHVLIALTFLGPRPLGMLVCHKNDVPTDNRLSNLYFGTRSDNEQDKLRSGNNRNAAKTHCKWGHEFTPENTLIFASRGDKRMCRACSAWRSRERRRKEAAA